MSISQAYVSPAQAFQCSDIFSKSNPSRLYVKSIEARGASRLYPFITSENASKIFTHNYDPYSPDKFGAKAVVINLPRKAPQVYFFATGEGPVSWDVHHLPAAEVALNLPRSMNLKSQIPIDQLQYVQGYEFTAVKKDNHWSIVELSILSQITVLKLVHFPELNHALEQQLLDLLLSRIDPSLMDFKIPDVRDIQ